MKRADRFVQRASDAALAGLVELDDVRQGRREVDRLERGWSHNGWAACAPIGHKSEVYEMSRA